MKVVCLGTSIKTYVDDVLKHDFTDSDMSTATKHGLCTGTAATDTTSTHDNFLVVP
jgi:hypothetical protein